MTTSANTFKEATERFHQEQIRILRHDVDHLTSVVVKHTAVLHDPDTLPGEAEYRQASVDRSEAALAQRVAELEEWHYKAQLFADGVGIES